MNYEDWEALRFAAGPLPPDRQAVLLRVATALTKLGPNSVALLDDVATRLVAGLSYGDWDHGLDLVRESQFETTDAIDYTTVELRRAEARVAALRRVQGKLLEADSALREVPAE